MRLKAKNGKLLKPLWFLQTGDRNCPNCIQKTKVYYFWSEEKTVEVCESCGRSWYFTGYLNELSRFRLIEYMGSGASGRSLDEFTITK